MKIRFKAVLTTALAAALLLTGCGDSSSKLSESQLYEQEFDTSKYDSHITYAVEGTSSEKELTKVAQQLEQRIERCFAERNDDHPSIAHQMQTDHGDKTVTIYFNNNKHLSRQFMDYTAAPNKVEIRKGKNPDGELVIGSEDIYDAYRVFEYPTTGEPYLVVNINLTDNGKKKCEKKTKELMEKGETLTVRIDGQTVFSPIRFETASGDSFILNRSELLDNKTPAAWELAYRLRAGYLENKVTVKQCSLSDKTETA